MQVECTRKLGTATHTWYLGLWDLWDLWRTPWNLFLEFLPGSKKGGRICVKFGYLLVKSNFVDINSAEITGHTCVKDMHLWVQISYLRASFVAMSQRHRASRMQQGSEMSHCKITASWSW